MRAGRQRLPRVGDLPVDGAAERDVVAEASAGVAQQIQHLVGGYVADDELEVGLRIVGMDLLQGAVESEAAFANRREAANAFDGTDGVAICRSAGDVKVERTCGLEGLAVKVAGGGGDLKRE